jgi:hypothetical protein
MTVQQPGAAGSVRLPLDLAPSLAEQVLRLLSEVHTTVAPDLVIEVHQHDPRCVVCHRSGKLGGHHGLDGQVQWIHRKCHRRLHRSGRHVVVVPAQRRSLYAC